MPAILILLIAVSAVLWFATFSIFGFWAFDRIRRYRAPKVGHPETTQEVLP